MSDINNIEFLTENYAIQYVLHDSKYDVIKVVEVSNPEDLRKCSGAPIAVTQANTINAVKAFHWDATRGREGGNLMDEFEQCVNNGLMTLAPTDNIKRVVLIPFETHSEAGKFIYQLQEYSGTITEDRRVRYKVSGDGKVHEYSVADMTLRYWSEV